MALRYSGLIPRAPLKGAKTLLDKDSGGLNTTISKVYWKCSLLPCVGKEYKPPRLLSVTKWTRLTRRFFVTIKIPRDKLLAFIAPYNELYAIGRCALEGLVLGCKILPFYHVYPDPAYWHVLDNRIAACMLQRALDEIEGGATCVDCFQFPEYLALG